MKCLLGSDQSDDSEFEVEYERFEGIYKRKLIDLKNNLIVVVGSISVVDKRKRLISTGSDFEEESGIPRDGKRKKRQGKKIHKAKGKKESGKKDGEDLAEKEQLLIMMKLLMTSLWRMRNQQMKDRHFLDRC